METNAECGSRAFNEIDNPISVRRIAASAQGLSASVAPWANLTAVAVITCLFVWIITGGFPKLLEKHEDTLKQQRADFRELLQEERAASREAARNGHQLAHEMTTVLNELTLELKSHKERAQ